MTVEEKKSIDEELRRKYSEVYSESFDIIRYDEYLRYNINKTLDNINEKLGKEKSLNTPISEEQFRYIMDKVNRDFSRKEEKIANSKNKNGVTNYVKKVSNPINVFEFSENQLEFEKVLSKILLRYPEVYSSDMQMIYKDIFNEDYIINDDFCFPKFFQNNLYEDFFFRMKFFKTILAKKQEFDKKYLDEDDDENKYVGYANSLVRNINNTEKLLKGFLLVKLRRIISKYHLNLKVADTCNEILQSMAKDYGGKYEMLNHFSNMNGSIFKKELYDTIFGKLYKKYKNDASILPSAFTDIYKSIISSDWNNSKVKSEIDSNYLNEFNSSFEFLLQECFNISQNCAKHRFNANVGNYNDYVISVAKADAIVHNTYSKSKSKSKKREKRLVVDTNKIIKIGAMTVVFSTVLIVLSICNNNSVFKTIDNMTEIPSVHISTKYNDNYELLVRDIIDRYNVIFDNYGDTEYLSVAFYHPYTLVDENCLSIMDDVVSDVRARTFMSPNNINIYEELNGIDCYLRYAYETMEELGLIGDDEREEIISLIDRYVGADTLGGKRTRFDSINSNDKKAIMLFIERYKAAMNGITKELADKERGRK